MPDIIAHANMGKEVVQRLSLDVDRDIFSFGLLGPDPFLYCWPEYNMYSSIMHRDFTGDFLLELAGRVRDRETFSYLAGFLCHYALDSVAHPHIIKLARNIYGDTGKSKFMHIAIEHRIDILEGGKYDIPKFPPDTIREMFDGSIEKIYGWKDAWVKLKRRYWHIKPFYAIIGDRFGIFNKLTGWSRTSFSMVSSKSHICDGMDLEWFKPLYAQSIEDAIMYIKGALRFIRGEIEIEEFSGIIGNRSYL